jgi:hypothetical protein
MSLQVTEARLDTDNIRLSDLESAESLEVALELEALLVTGTCIDVSATTRGELYPRGSQLVLSSPSAADVHDTLVMSNLGYFQLQARPGAVLVALLTRMHLLLDVRKKYAESRGEEVPFDVCWKQPAEWHLP